MSEQESDDNTGELKIKKKKSGNVNLLQDDRFKGLFADADFQVDATSHEYKLHHPSESQSKVTARKFEPVEDDDEDDDKIRFTRFKNKEQSGPKFFELKVSYLTSLFRMDLVRPQRHPKSWKRSKVKLWILPLEYKQNPLARQNLLAELLETSPCLLIHQRSAKIEEMHLIHHPLGQNPKGEVLKQFQNHQHQKVVKNHLARKSKSSLIWNIVEKIRNGFPVMSSSNSFRKCRGHIHNV
jgi:hypothetical protein